MCVILASEESGRVWHSYSEELSNTGYGLAIYDDYAYLTSGSTGLLVIDVSDPVSPSRVNTVDLPGAAYDIAITENQVHINTNAHPRGKGRINIGAKTDFFIF